MQRLCLLLLVLTFFSNLGYSYVSWDGYLFVITAGTARLKKDGEIIFVCDRREVKIIDNHLLVDRYMGKGVDILLDPATAIAIGHEFTRDTDSCRARWGADGHPAHPHPVPPVPVDPPETTPPPDKVPATISLPAARGR